MYIYLLPFASIHIRYTNLRAVDSDHFRSSMQHPFNYGNTRLTDTICHRLRWDFPLAAAGANNWILLKENLERLVVVKK